MKEISKQSFDPAESARRTIAWYHFFFRKYPIAVISASERQANEPAANLAGAARALVESFKIRVIIDSSPGSLDSSVLNSGRAIVMDLDRLSKTQLFSIPEVTAIFENQKNWEEIAWEVLGEIR